MLSHYPLQVSSQIVTFEHEGNWNKALEYYDLLIRKAPVEKNVVRESGSDNALQLNNELCAREVKESWFWKLHKGLIRSLQQIGCSHILDVYFRGLTNQKCYLVGDMDFIELQVCCSNCGNLHENDKLCLSGLINHLTDFNLFLFFLHISVEKYV